MNINLDGNINLDSFIRASRHDYSTLIQQEGGIISHGSGDREQNRNLYLTFIRCVGERLGPGEVAKAEEKFKALGFNAEESMSSKQLKSVLKVLNIKHNDVKTQDLGYEKGKAIRSFIIETAQQEGESESGERPNFSEMTGVAVAFHQPFTTIKEMQDQEYEKHMNVVDEVWDQKLEEQMKKSDYKELKKKYFDNESKSLANMYLETPSYSCHDIAAQALNVLGEEEPREAGGYKQVARAQAIDLAIKSLRQGIPCIISIKSKSESDDGHSFCLVLREDGLVDSLEGWATGTGAPADITTGEKQGMDKSEVIEALEKIKLNPANPKHDIDRSEGYKKLSQAYDDSTKYHLMSHPRAIEKFLIPDFDKTKPLTDFPVLHKSHLTGDKAKPVCVKEGKVYGVKKTFGFTWDKSVTEGAPLTIIERDYKLIEISVRVKNLRLAKAVKEIIQANLVQERDTLDRIQHFQELTKSEAGRIDLIEDEIFRREKELKRQAKEEG